MLIGFNSDKEKTRLQNRMAYGQDCAPIDTPTKPSPSDNDNDNEIDRFEEGMYPSSYNLDILSQRISLYCILLLPEE